MADGLFYAIYLSAGIFMIIKPFVMDRMVMQHKSGEFILLKVLSDFLILFISSFFIEVGPYFYANQLIALIMEAFSIYLLYLGFSHKK